MRFLKQIFNFYIDSSIHVALAAYALVRMTQHMFATTTQTPVAPFVFWGTIVGYNFVKYDALARTGKLPIRTQLKAIIALSCVSFFAAVACFFKLRLCTQTIAIIFLGLTTLYTLPFFPNRQNARNWKGIKIYIVTLCWVGVTVVLPVIEAEIAITADFWLKCTQRFLVVFALILIFEIIDLRTDDPNLQTVPQKIGVKRAKILGWLLLLAFYSLEFLQTNVAPHQLFVNVPLVVIIALFLMFANENRTKYYTSFWAESIPIFWWMLVRL
jgi:hypothetical protein